MKGEEIEMESDVSISESYTVTLVASSLFLLLFLPSS